MDLNHWIAGGAVGGVALGIVTAFWAKIKIMAWRIVSVFVCQIEILDDNVSNAILGKLIQTLSRGRLYDRSYGGTYEYSRDGKYGIVPYEYFGSKALVFWDGWRPVVFGLQKTQNNNSGNGSWWWTGGSSYNQAKTTLTFLRGTFDAEGFINEAVKERNSLHWTVSRPKDQRRFFIKEIPDSKSKESEFRYSVGTGIAWYHEGKYRLLQHKPSELGKCQPGSRRALDTLIFPERIKNLIREITIWVRCRDWYIERCLPWKRGWILYGPPGTGKCFGKGTPILMFDGSVRPVEDVAVGDLVMGPDSKPRRVLSLARGKEKMYRVVPRKGTPYVVNESHILSLRVSSPFSKYKRDDIVNISVLDYLSRPEWHRHCLKGWRTGVDFRNQPVPLDPYLLGVWLGDGHRKKTSITNGSVEILEYLVVYCQKNGLFLMPETKSGESWTFSIVGSPKMAGDNHEGQNPVRNSLKELGVFSNKFVPQVYKANDRSVRLAVLAGLIDTDGSLSCNGYEITLKPERLAEDAVFLARSLGLAAYVKPCIKECCNNGKKGLYYRVFISGNTDMIPVRIAYKIATPRRQKKNALNTGVVVEPLPKDNYYGFAVDGDHLFLLGDFTVTHNSAVVRAFAEDLDMPLFVFSLGELMNSELQRAWDDMQAHRPCIALFEDLDAVFNGRSNVAGMGGLTGLTALLAGAGEQKATGPPANNSSGDTPKETKTDGAKETIKRGMLSFDCLLNCIDGVKKSDGIFTVITTNDLSKIDPALGQPRLLDDGSIEFISTRPGRIDKAIELGYMEHQHKLIMAERIVGDYPEGHEQVLEFLRKHPDLQETPAQFQERCSQVALACFWKKQCEAEGMANSQ